MDINEIRKHKRVMESEIYTQVAGAMIRFREETGMSPIDITIRLEPRILLGQPLHDCLYVVGSVQVRIEV